MRHSHSLPGKPIRQFVFGSNDGLVTMLGILAGFSGANLEGRLVVLAGLVAAFAGALSMAVGEYLSTKSQVNYYIKKIRDEEKEINERPAEEKKRVRAMYAKKGFTHDDLDRVVAIITSNKKVWLKTILEEDIGLSPSHFEHPFLNALFMGFAFIAASFVALTPYFFTEGTQALTFAVLFSILAFVIIGIAKTFFTGRKKVTSSVETLAFGMAVFIVSFYLGTLFDKLIS